MKKTLGYGVVLTTFALVAAIDVVVQPAKLVVLVGEGTQNYLIKKAAKLNEKLSQTSSSTVAS